MKKNALTIGSWLQLNSPSAAEIMSQSGFEWLTVDMEHSVTSLETMQHLLQIIEGHNIVPLVRVGENNPDLIKRVMDAGAYGIIVPMINSADDAKKAVNAVKYPPQGTRGVGIARAQGYGRNFEEYASVINRESVVIVQIEHINAVNNLEEIISVDGVDGCFIGPYDLSGSLGIPGNLTHIDVLAAVSEVERICRERKMPLGIHVVDPDISLMNKYIQAGYTLLAFSSDMLLLEKICREKMAALAQVRNK
ncbi:MAG: aldolase/citrate lyase family protein [Methanoregula sp.]|uniref:HpcH/HpaI aldolase family protein n=1 Tax=Methanoregula sp. TaxID=2052170 RepID=UPI003C20BDFF